VRDATKCGNGHRDSPGSPPTGCRGRRGITRIGVRDGNLAPALIPPGRPGPRARRWRGGFGGEPARSGGGRTGAWVGRAGIRRQASVVSRQSSAVSDQPSAGRALPASIGELPGSFPLCRRLRGPAAPLLPLAAARARTGRPARRPAATGNRSLALATRSARRRVSVMHFRPRNSLLGIRHSQLPPPTSR
jgi:hypothetical protein